jgi:Fur family ferric uptake transcriptional regulator
MARGKHSDSEALRVRIRSAGLRCTAARLAVLEHLASAAGPRTHADVSAALAGRGFDRATIYRNLTELTEARLVNRVELGDHVWRFEIRRPEDQGSHDRGHPHFLCTTCGEVSCLDDVSVAITPTGRPRTRGAARERAADGRAVIHTVTEVLLKGRCEGCG